MANLRVTLPGSLGSVCPRCQALQTAKPRAVRTHCRAAATALKKEGHPDYYEEAKVFCNGEEVMVTSGTMPEYKVDIWSGNHPFFQGSTNNIITDEGRVNRFQRRYANSGSLGEFSPASSSGPAKFEKAKKDAKKGKGKNRR